MMQPEPTPGQTDIWPLVSKDLAARVKLGRERYGTVLQTNNGRNPLQDAYEEALDLVLYLRQAIEERNMPLATGGKEKGAGMTNPIKPHEVEVTKPDEAIEVFNSLIRGSWDGRQAKVDQKTAATLIAEKMGMPREEVFARKYLDIEGVFRDAGWEVTYEKPALNEDSFPPFFVFTDGGEASS